MNKKINREVNNKTKYNKSINKTIESIKNILVTFLDKAAVILQKLSKEQKLCILAGFVLGAIAFVTSDDSIFVKKNTIERGEYGRQAVNYKVDVSGIGDDKTLKFMVSPKRLSRDEADNIYEGISSDITYTILGENESLSNI